MTNKVQTNSVSNAYVSSGNTISWGNNVFPAYDVTLYYSSQPPFTVPTKVVFNGDTTIVFWKDGDKTIVKRKWDDPVDPEHAVASAIAQKLFGSKTKFRKFVARGHRQLTKNEKKNLEDDLPF